MKNNRIIMKIATLAVASSLTFACGEASVSDEKAEVSSQLKSDDESIYAVRLCGTIYRFMADSGTSAGNVIKIGSALTEVSKHVTVLGADSETQAILAAIVWPNDAYIGCVHGDEIPSPGFEGMYFTAKKIDLQGQSTGFSVGNGRKLK